MQIRWKNKGFALLLRGALVCGAGVYAAGDIRVKQVRQVATAVSDGAIAAINAAL